MQPKHAAWDERAFLALVERLHGPMVRIAQKYVFDYQIAQEVVQETWMGVLRGLAHFEQRSSLQTWIFHILANRAKTRARREQQTISFSAFLEPGDDEAAVSPDHFQAENDVGWWIQHPNLWHNQVEDQVLWQETVLTIQHVVQDLPPSQRTVITLRDIEGWTAAEVCSRLKISEENQRVLLHRACSKVRRVLEQYFGTKEE